MTTNRYMAAAGAFALIGITTLSSCSENDEMLTETAAGGRDAKEFSLSIKGMPAAPAGAPTAAAAAQDAISVFQFGTEGLFSKSVISSYDPAGIDLIKGTTRGLYCVTGIDIDADEETSEEEFLLTTVSSGEGANSAPLFLSGKAAIDPEQMECELTMKRGVARIDIDARDADMDITSITVEDAPSATYVFAGTHVYDAPTATYTYEYATAPTGVDKGVFMLFEADRDVHVTVNGTADGMELSVPAVLEGVERNKVYTLRVYDKNATVKAGFSVADWEEGDDILSGPDMSKGLTIDMAASSFPAGINVDYLNNIIEVPGDGVKGMKIAFSSEVRVDIDSIFCLGERVELDSVAAKYVHVKAEKAFNTETGVITKFDVNIDEQLKGRPDYQVKIGVKKTYMSTCYDYVTIKVAPSKFQIPTVELAGITWMAFNAYAPDPDSQVYVEEGKTAEDMYTADWVGCTGYLFQFGRRYGYIPYQGYNPVNNLGDQKQDIPWVNYSHMPCPEGYHVPSLAEWHTLFPEGTVLEHGTSYVAGNGETINVELVRLPGDVVTPTNVNGVCRYMKLTSEETGNSLIFPLGGYKGDKSTAVTANFGRDMVYWSNENTNCNGGHARAMRFMFNWGNKCTAEEFQWPMEAFAYVRAVKN